MQDILNFTNLQLGLPTSRNWISPALVAARRAAVRKRGVVQLDRHANRLLTLLVRYVPLLPWTATLWQTAVQLSVRLWTICRRRGRRTFGENAANVDYQLVNGLTDLAVVTAASAPTRIDASTMMPSAGR